MAARTDESSSMFPSCYDVFLSFRGEDTRKNFTDHLYTALVNAGIRTYRDDEKLERGEEIGPNLFKAIQESRISIPVFSTNYASSTWCLEELTKIMECKKTMGQTVLPVFFSADPSDVRKQTGSFEEAFLRHEEKFEKKTVERWREALREAGKLSGWNLKDVANGHEAKLIQLVLKKVLSKLNNTPLDVTQHPVGIDSRVEDMMRLLNVESRDVWFLGICGMGGIGKTTIAKAVFNRIVSYFEGSSFLEDVSENSKQPKDLVSLQNQLVLDILKENQYINTVSRGINVIKERFRAKKVFIVLDDVDNNMQLNSLVGEPNWFGPGSRIIITTRDEHILNVHGVNEIYKPKEMDLNQSLELFSKHAFGRDQPLEEYIDLSEEIILTTGGLPLALEVLGSFLYDKRIRRYWESTLDKLKKIPLIEVREQLKISFHGLDFEEKEIFLDIACFFIGMDKDTVINIWEGCDFSSRIGIEALINKSLVKIGDHNELRMHDQIRDMGRQIIRQESPRDPGNCSRLWTHAEALDVLKKHTGTRNVKGLLLTFEAEENIRPEIDGYSNEASSPTISEERHLSTKAFELMSQLRLLRVDYAVLVGDFRYISPELRWLSWRGCPLEFIPTNFHLEKLVVLDLSGSSIKRVWDDGHQNKMFINLKVLDLSYCRHLIRTPHFSGHSSLERLNLESCTGLVEIHKSIGNLKKLIFLNLQNCSGLLGFPSSILTLDSLENITLSGCSRFNKLPGELGAIESLRELFLDRTAIEQLPDSIGCLKNLSRLLLNECRSLRKLPNSLSKLESLRELALDGAGVEEIPVLIGSLKKLEILSARWCGSLTVLPDSIGDLESLSELALDGTAVLELPSSIGLLLKLQLLSLSGCQFLRKIPDSVGRMESLMDLILDRTPIREMPHFCGTQNKLEKLEIRLCKSFSRLPDSINYAKSLTILRVDGSVIKELPNSLGYLESLRELILDDTPIENIPVSIGCLKRLEILSTRRCKSLTKLPNSIGDLESLLDLTLDDTGIRKLPHSIGSLQKLRCLSLCGCLSLSEIPDSFGRIESLNELILNGTQIAEIPDSISNIRNLKTLWIEGTLLTELPNAIGSLEKLEKLSIRKCKKLVKLPDSMGGLRLLKHFKMDETGIVQLPKDFGMLRSLETLEMSGCQEFKGFPENIGSLTRLGELYVPYNSKLTMLPTSFSGLCSLRQLNASHCNLLEGAIPSYFGRLSSLGTLKLGHNNFSSLPASISSLSQLKYLYLPHCTKLQYLQELPLNLSRLDVGNCISLERLPDLSNLKKLEELILTNCEKLMEIQGIERLKSLSSLTMSGCNTNRNSLRKIFVQGVFERLQNFSFPGSYLPDWFAYRKLPCVVRNPPDREIVGVILCIIFALEEVQTDIDEEDESTVIRDFRALIRRNNTGFYELELIITGIPKCHQDQIYLCYIQPGNIFVDELEDGDQIQVSVKSTPKIQGIKLKEVGVHLVYKPVKGSEAKAIKDCQHSDVSQLLADFFYSCDADGGSRCISTESKETTVPCKLRKSFTRERNMMPRSQDGRVYDLRDLVRERERERVAPNGSTLSLPPE